MYHFHQPAQRLTHILGPASVAITLSFWPYGDVERDTLRLGVNTKNINTSIGLVGRSTSIGLSYIGVKKIFNSNLIIIIISL
jgi:hypothetical protein